MIFRRLSFYLALAGVAAGFFLVRRLREVPPAPAPLAEPARSPYADFVAASGIIEARGENVAVAAPRAGLVMRVLVEVGSDVKAGDPLVELDRREALARVETARAQLASLEAARTVERVAIEDWSDQYARIRRLEKDEVATEDERKRKGFALEAAKARLTGHALAMFGMIAIWVASGTPADQLDGAAQSVPVAPVQVLTVLTVTRTIPAG